MSYGNAGSYNKAGNKYAAGGKPAVKPATVPAAKAAPVAGESTGKRRPTYDIVAVDGEGQIMKNEEGHSLRLGAIWTNDKGGMFIKFNEAVEPGTTAKTFAVKQDLM
jgi:hypothetical protein